MNKNGFYAYLMLIIGVIAYMYKDYPIYISVQIGLSSSLYITMHMLMFSTMHLIVASPFMFLREKWRDSIISILMAVITVISIQHYLDVKEKPYLYLDFKNHPTTINRKAVFT